MTLTDFEPSLFRRILRKSIGFLKKLEREDNRYWLNKLDALGINLSEKDVNLKEILNLVHHNTQTLSLKKIELIQERNASYHHYKDNSDLIIKYETTQSEQEQLQLSLKDTQGEIVCILQDLTGRSQVAILKRFIYVIDCTKSHLPISWNDFYIALLQDIQDILDVYVRPNFFI